MEEHIRMLIKFIDDLVQFVEGDSETQQIINSSSKCIGQQHAVNLGENPSKITLIFFQFLSRTSQLSANVWDKLGEIVMEKVCSVECVQVREGFFRGTFKRSKNFFLS